jgi:Skp family chaperone for outer membrane proteins
MTKLHSLTVAVVASTFLLSAQDAGKTPGPVAVDAAAKAVVAPTIGVVDFVKAFDQYPRYIEMRTQLDALGKTYDDRLKEMSKTIDELRGQLKMIKEDSDERAEREFAVERAIADQRALAKILRDRLDVENMRMMVLVYQDFEEAIRRVAEKRGMTLVLRVHDMGDAVSDPGKLSPKNVETRIAGFERKQVWFAAAPIDITQDVIKLLMVPLDDNKGGEQKAPAAPAGPQKDGE